jgi:hypothetical protein
VLLSRSRSVRARCLADIASARWTSRSPAISSLSRRLASRDQRSMWNSIPPQHAICPSSLTSRACLSHRARPSMVSSPSLAHGTPPNKWLISHGDPHGDRFSKLSLCALFSLTRSASLPTLHPVSPVLWGRALKEATPRSGHTHTHMRLTDIKRPQATSDRSFL